MNIIIAIILCLMGLASLTCGGIGIGRLDKGRNLDDFFVECVPWFILSGALLLGLGIAIIEHAIT